ncbi:MAG: EI24 domain-containing protein [Pseudomonadota bacterium]
MAFDTNGTPKLARVARAWGRALGAQLHPRMLLLSAAPFLLSVALWGVLLYLGLQPLIDYVQGLFLQYDVFQASSSWLGSLGLGALKTLVVPLIAMLLLLPLMILTALLFIGVAAMPAIVRHVGARHFPLLEKKAGGSWIGSVLVALASFLVFIVLWCLALPLYAFPPLALAAQVLLWGWLTYRVMVYDALADHASEAERQHLMREHRSALLLIGMVSGAAGALPGMVWVGGMALSVVLFPFLAAASIWLYVMIFIFTGLWFEFYCLQALADARPTILEN